MRYLIVCESNYNRSKEAARLWKRILKARGLESEIETAGFRDERKNPFANPFKFLAYMFMKRISQETLAKADRVFVMEDWMLHGIKKRFDVSEEKLYCLDIPDGNAFQSCPFMNGKKSYEIERKLNSLPKEAYLLP